MRAFRDTNLEHIRDIFQEKTGVEFCVTRSQSRIRGVLILAAVLCCLTAGAAAGRGLFSSLDGDELAFRAVYQGDGVIAIEVENRSERDLNFQQQIKLKRWTTGEELEPTGPVWFENEKVPAGTTQTATIDISAAYDLAMLEQPLTDDWYYLILTNRNYAFGQDWMCSVDFAENLNTQKGDISELPLDVSVLPEIEEKLRPYFECSSMDPQERRKAEEEYVRLYTEILKEHEEFIVPSVSPVLPGNQIDLEKPYLTLRELEETQDFSVGLNWVSRDDRFKLVAREGEYALVLSAMLPSERYRDAYHSVALFYLLTYEKEDISADRQVFIYGRLFDFSEMEPYKIYEDESYVCYEVSSLMHSDPLAYAKEFAQYEPDICWNTESETYLENVYHSYKAELGNLIMYR